MSNKWKTVLVLLCHRWGLGRAWDDSLAVGPFREGLSRREAELAETGLGLEVKGMWCHTGAPQLAGLQGGAMPQTILYLGHAYRKAAVS